VNAPPDVVSLQTLNLEQKFACVAVSSRASTAGCRTGEASALIHRASSLAKTKEARRVESASFLRGYSRGALGAIRDCWRYYSPEVKKRFACTRPHP
jgi:hypothetical protein